MAAKYWLMKSEPEVYSIDRLAKDGHSLWEGVRNYQARNFMMKDMEIGDEILFYHSSADPIGIAGLAKVSSQAVADPSQFNRKSDYFDGKSTHQNPRWFCVEVSFVEKFKTFITLEMLKNEKALSEMLVLKRGQRLSIQPVTGKDFEFIKKWGRQ